MKGIIDTLLNIYKIEELRNRIILTLGLLLVYRLGAQVVLPGIDSIQLSELSNRTSGGIMPYISASIVVQLMGIGIPYLQKLQKEGESGRKTINQITRWLTIGICIVQAPAYLFGLSALGVPDSAFVIGRGPIFMISSVVLTFLGLDFTSALGAAASSLGNIGPAIGSVSPVDNFAHLSAGAKWFCSFLMLIGRLELFTVLILFTPFFWRKN